MKTNVYKSTTRGEADYGWLKAKYSFSFANYYNPEMMGFGLLRVLNDDTIAAGTGFPTHPHDNMEIITIPLSGSIAHKDSMGNESVIKAGEIQVMSAGTGIFHSEYNYLKDQELRLFQIWIQPNIKNVKPRYQQLTINELEKENKFFMIVSPKAEEQGLWIHQDSWLHLGGFNEDIDTSYQIKQKGNGIYIMVIEGEVNIEGNNLITRDAIGITEVENINIRTIRKSKLLVIEVPMN